MSTIEDLWEEDSQQSQSHNSDDQNPDTFMSYLDQVEGETFDDCFAKMLLTNGGKQN